MKNLTKFILFLFTAVFFSACGDSEKKENDTDDIKIGDYDSETPAQTSTPKNSADMVDFSNKGIGPVNSVSLNDDIDQALATRGTTIFENMCSACHKIDKKFIGPAVKGVTERRSPEWIMNMILNPEEMIAKDPIAKQLMIESNMAVMANQNLTEEEARAILEYFRSLDQEI